MRHRSTRVVRLLWVACLLAAPETARAVDLMRPLDGGERVPFRIVPAIDLALMGLGLSVVAGLKFTAAPPPADRPPETLWDLDAPIVTWGVHDEALWTSDLAVSTAVAAATADAAVSAGRDDVEAGAVKFTLYAQSVMTTLALTEIAKQSFQRPRPCTHQPARRLRPHLGCGPDDKDAYLSFFSGHSATAAALSATATTLSYGDDGFGTRTAVTLAACSSAARLARSSRICTARRGAVMRNAPARPRRRCFRSARRSDAPRRGDGPVRCGCRHLAEVGRHLR